MSVKSKIKRPNTHPLFSKETTEERLRISRELHDGILSDLHGLKMYIGCIKKNNITINELNLIENQISDIQQELYLILNNHLNINNCFEENLKSKLTILSKGSSTKLILDLSKKINWKKYQDALKNDIDKICREALINSIKHGKSTLFNLKIRLKKEHLKITIQDNGSGFNKTAVIYGNGILNTIKRLQKHKSSLNLNSNSKGTQLSFLIKT